MTRDVLTRGALAVALLTLALVRPHVVERWALYLGAPSDVRGAHLFLDPFPDATSCETRVRTFEANGERAFCASRRQFEFGSAQDAVLAADFDPFFAYAWYCSPHHPKL